MRKLLLIPGIMFVASVVIGLFVQIKPLGGGTKTDAQLYDEKIAAIKSDLIAEEQNYKTADNYKQVLPTKLTDGTEYRVDEYVTPDGSKGYQVYLKRKDGSETSYGEGPEALIRSYDLATTTIK